MPVFTSKWVAGVHLPKSCSITVMHCIGFGPFQHMINADKPPTNEIYYTMIPYDTIWYHMIPYDTIWYHMTPYDTIWMGKDSACKWIIAFTENSVFESWSSKPAGLQRICMILGLNLDSVFGSWSFKKKDETNLKSPVADSWKYCIYPYLEDHPT